MAKKRNRDRSNSYYSKDDVITHSAISAEKEAELFKRYFASPEDALTEDSRAARDFLIENNLRYAAAIALKLAKQRQHRKDLISAANLGLIKALTSRRFDPSKGRFTTFATKYIKGEIYAQFRTACAVTFPATMLPEWPEGGEDPTIDDFEDPNAFHPSQLDYDALYAALDSLDPRESQIIELTFLDGESVSSAARTLGVGRQWAFELRKRALVNLRLALGVPQQVAEDGEVELEEAA